ncbi:M23 family metallopeptidase [Streptomyces sp. NBC_01429]|uniref:M23 family metallopeptidase n=1 Tax=Streptomyces sp. NBC_01429 TaxID=2903862 RepID=UPI002E2A1A28|nr:M23 family metallopeptidase [Streptomyces sp. NBC_01429]
MAFTRATGKHRARNGRSRRGASAAGAATLTATGVIGTLAASPALAADARVEAASQTGLAHAIALGDSLPGVIDDQADAQRHAADRVARIKAEAVAKAEARRMADARAKEIRAERQRAARAAERERLNTFQLPVAGSYITTGYRTGGSLWSSGSHSGVDFRAATGTSVVAVGAATVVEAGWGGSYGNNIVLRMSDGTYTQYGHLSSIAVSVGQSVAAGQRIGLSGATGNATGPHLHFEARTGQEYGTDMDPAAYLRAHGVTV